MAKYQSAPAVHRCRQMQIERYTYVKIERERSYKEQAERDPMWREIEREYLDGESERLSHLVSGLSVW